VNSLTSVLLLPLIEFIHLPQVDESKNNHYRQTELYGARSEDWSLRGVCKPPNELGRHPFNIITSEIYD
jgi:hypothetical protein